MPRRGDYRVGDQGWWTEMEIRLLWIKHSYLYFTDLQEFVGTLLRSLFAASPVLLITSKTDRPLFNYVLLSLLSVQVRDFTVNSHWLSVVIVSFWLFNLHLSVPMLNINQDAQHLWWLIHLHFWCCFENCQHPHLEAMLLRQMQFSVILDIRV